MSIYPAGSTSEVDLLLDFAILENGPIVHFWWLVVCTNRGCVGVQPKIRPITVSRRICGPTTMARYITQLEDPPCRCSSRKTMGETRGTVQALNTGKQFSWVQTVPGPVIFLVQTPPGLVNSRVQALGRTRLSCGSRPFSGGADRESRRCGILDCATCRGLY
jgi:hypothetical protein